MQTNPLFPSDDQSNPPVQAGDDPAVEMIRRKIQNLYAGEPDVATEPTAAVASLQPDTRPVSAHQAYMHSLTASGKTPAEIQQAWHAYYTNLPDTAKYEVWQEFYSQQNQADTAQVAAGATPAASRSEVVTPTVIQPASAMASTGRGSMQQVLQPLPQNLPPSQNPIIAAAAVAEVTSKATFGTGGLAMPAPVADDVPAAPLTPVPTELRGRSKQRTTDALRQAAGRLRDTAGAGATASSIKDRILRTVRSENRQQQSGGRAKLTAKHHLQSLGFGLAAGGVVVVLFLGTFFNELVLAPLIQPSRTHNDTPVIVDLASAAVGKDPRVIIPKINVEIPVDYTQTTTSEKEIELALDKGVVHYPTTVRPGQTGNAAFFGHSSNNIFNPGKYKFAFVLLHELVEGDTFYLTNDGKTYAYRVFSKRIVQPTEVSVLNPIEGHPATATLITCDPPGTSINRLVVVGDQISPDLNSNQPGNQAPVQTAATDTGKQAELPANGPSLWSRIWGTIF